MLRASIQWRREHDIDTLVEREGHLIPPEIFKICPIAYCGISEEGYAVFINPFGRHDMRACLEQYGPELVNKYIVMFYERMVQLMKDEGSKRGIKCNQIIEIVDCEG
jgi:hypothetical protein